MSQLRRPLEHSQGARPAPPPVVGVGLLSLPSLLPLLLLLLLLPSPARLRSNVSLAGDGGTPPQSIVAVCADRIAAAIWLRRA